jgi:hypothetical protein
MYNLIPHECVDNIILGIFIIVASASCWYGLIYERLTILDLLTPLWALSRHLAAFDRLVHIDGPNVRSEPNVYVNVLVALPESFVSGIIIVMALWEAPRQ